MSRMIFYPVVSPTGSTVRIDTASGTNTPADITPLDRPAVSIAGSQLRANARTGVVEPFLGPDGVATLYQKQLNYAGVAGAVLATLTGVAQAVAVATGGGGGSTDLSAYETTAAITAQVAAATAGLAPAVPATLKGNFASGTVYAAGDRAVSPIGQVISAKTGFTAGATFDPTQWNQLDGFRNAPGIYMPQGWGRNTKAKLAAAAAGTGLLRVGLAGDSVSRGYFSSSLETKGWGGLLKAYLQTAYGNGGSGIKGMADTGVFQTAKGMAGATKTFYNGVSGDLIPTTGSWTLDSAGQQGPCGMGLLAGSATDTITYTGTGTIVDVYYPKVAGAFTVKIDAGAAVTVTPAGGAGIGQYTVTGLSAGSHTVLITATGWVTPGTTGTVGSVEIYAPRASNAVGCVFDNFSMYGQFASALGNGDTNRMGSWQGGGNNPVDLAIYADGLNDLAGGASSTTFAASVQGWASLVQDNYLGASSITMATTPTGATDLAFVVPHFGHFDTSKIGFSYHAVMRSIAEETGALLIDFNPIGRNSYSYWNGLGYWSNDSVPGTSGTDAVHLSDAGHAFMANTVISVFAAALAAP